MTDRPQAQPTYVKSLWIRLWHWTNAFLIIGLAITGASLHFSDPKFAVIEFSVALSLHNVAGSLLVALYVAFLVGNLVSGNWRRFLPGSSALARRCLAQARYYAWGIFKGDASPHSAPIEADEFNALQAIVYFGVLFLVMPVLVVSGLIYLFPQVAPAEFFGWSGLLPVALAHYLAAALVVAFLIGHIYLGTMGKSVTSSFRTMITGWHHH